jgi:mannose-6-phosphate isomerase-like protein (cupin superfamily)
MKTTPVSPGSSTSVRSDDSMTQSAAPSSLPGKPIVIPHSAGELFDRNGFGFHWKIEGHQAGGRFSVVHHPMAPHVLAAPLHRHNREDEYSYVLTGTMGGLLGDDVVTAGPGTWVFKPRKQWHTFWNAGDTPCEIIEIISPAGFENFFRGLRDVWPDMEKFQELTTRFELEIDGSSVPGLCERFGLKF